MERFMVVTDANRSGYLAVTPDTLCVKPEVRKDGEGGYCALFYHKGRSVAMGRMYDKEAMLNEIDTMFNKLMGSNDDKFKFPFEDVPEDYFEGEDGENDAEDDNADAVESEAEAIKSAEPTAETAAEAVAEE